MLGYMFICYPEIYSCRSRYEKSPSEEIVLIYNQPKCSALDRTKVEVLFCNWY